MPCGQVPKLNVCIRNFCMFSFHHLSNRRKKFNGKNFPIYGTELVQKIVHLASSLYVSRDGGPSYHRHDLLATVFLPCMNCFVLCYMLVGREAITVCSS